jgi:hypothetical protein
VSAVTETQPVPSNLAQLGIWLSQGWGPALRRFPALVLIALVADVPLALIRAASAGVDNGIASFLMGFPAIALITPLAKAAAIVAIDRWERGEGGAVAAAFATLLHRFPLLLLASVLWAVAVFAGVALLVIPGIIVLVLGQCLMGAVILEGRSLRQAARRSVELVRPRFFAVLALFAIVQIVAGAASGLLQAGFGLVLDGWLLELVASALSSPLAFAPLAVLFLRSRAMQDAQTARARADATT